MWKGSGKHQVTQPFLLPAPRLLGSPFSMIATSGHDSLGRPPGLDLSSEVLEKRQQVQCLTTWLPGLISSSPHSWILSTLASGCEVTSRSLL